MGQWWSCGGSLVLDVVAHWLGFGGSIVDMEWLIGRDVVAHWLRRGGS